MSGLLSKIKNDVQKSGSNKSKIIYFREGTKKRVRFLTDMDDGIEVVMHDNFERGICVPCKETFGKSCEYCDDEDLRTRSNYVWSVYDYDDNDVKLFMFAVSRCSPIPPIMAMYENYGTLTDRDYVITQTGKGTTKAFSVVPMDKSKFRNTKAKAYSEKKIFDIIKKAWPYPDDSDDVDSDESWDEDDDSSKYSDMKPMELFKLCKERGIEAEKKKPSKYYINLLEEYDNAQDDWGDDDDDDYDDGDWEDDE